MSRETQPVDITRRRVVFRVPGAEALTVRRDLEFAGADGDTLALDIYHPPAAPAGARVPAVVIVAGFPDPGFEAKVGCKFKEMGSSVSWAEITAASGMAAITYTNREPAADLHALLRHVRQNAGRLGVDENRIGLWASSGNVPVALSALMEKGYDFLRCAVLCYGYTLDLDGGAGVAEASKAWGFANPCAGRTVEDLPPDVPLFVVRAGQDQLAHLNEALERFLAAAVARNLPVTFVNHPAAPHAFDLLDDGDATREIIARILSFMRSQLLPHAPHAFPDPAPKN
jgi:dienelactone hydrolase